MSLAAPQFLLLLPLWVLLGWRFRRLELWRPLRAGLLFLLVLLLCEPRMVLKSGGIDLWVLMDRSRSAEQLVDAGETEWRGLLERSRPGESHRLHFLDYAEEVIVQGRGEGLAYDGGRGRTRTALALRETLARMDPRRHNRILVFTDGYSTEPLDGIAAKLVEAGAPLDYRIVRTPDSTDFRVAAIEMPARTRPGEPFFVEVALAGTADATVPIEIFRGETRIHRGEAEVRGGRGRLRFSDRLAEPGAHLYSVEISPERDAHPGNNRQERWIEVVAGPRILLATAYQEEPLAEVLRAQGFDVAVAEDPSALGPGLLAGARAVVLNNVPAHALAGDFLGALPFFVAEQGGGLLMAGGQRSFGAGGYHDSVVDALLPVTMELKSEHRKLGVAMVIVMDRSGSMAMTTPSGHSKMQLGNEGAARTVELLGENDAVAVFAVDTAPHEITPLLNVGKHRGELISRIGRIESMGGGIYVYTGLKAAWEVLKKSPLGQRHVILFTDAADSEEPGDYVKLLAEMREGGTTVSVIGLGTRADSDAEFIEDVARRGEGRIFFTEEASEIPNIFAQETVTVARSTFVDEETGAKSTGRWHELASRDADWLPAVDGYNLSYLREGDEAALVSADDYAAPLVAFGRRGIGRSAAVSFPLGGDFSARVREWSHYGDFVQTLSRWLMGDELPPGLGLRHRLDGSRWTLDLHYAAEPWEERFAAEPPRVLIETGYRSRGRRELVWERISPGRYTVSADLEDSVPARAAVQVGGAALTAGPVVVGGDAEWKFDESRVAELRETARASGGEELLDLSKAWRRPPAPSEEPVRMPLLVAVLALFLLDALVTRTGWRLPVFLPARLRSRPGKRRVGLRRLRKKRPAPVQAPDPAPSDPAATATEPPPIDEAARRRSRFDRAKRGR